MPLGILNNIPSLAAENQLTLTSTALSNTLQQLSSGSRINSGADDPAGLSIANGLQANISALTQSVSNANNGVGQLQLADGALAQVTNLLNTAVTLATESATGTVSNGQRTSIQAQYASILAEINRIGSATTYNGQAVFQSGVTTNLNAVDSSNNGTTAPLTALSPLTTGDVTTVSAGGITFTYTAGSGNTADPNTVTGSNTGLGGGTPLGAGAVLTLTRASGTTTYTVNTGGATVQQLLNAVNTGTVATGVNLTIAGTDTSHANYTASLNPAGSLQITDLNNDNDLAATLTGQSTGSTTQFSTSGQNFSTTTALAANEVITIARTGQTATYTVGAGGSTLGALITAINTGQNQGSATNTITVAATAGTLAVASANLNGAISNGNFVVTDTSALGGLAVSESTGAAVTSSVQAGTAYASGAATALNAGYTLTLTRGGANTTYTVNAGGTATAQALLQAINSGVSTSGVGGVTVGGAGSAAGFSASIDANNKLNVTDTTYNSGGLTAVESGIFAPNEVATTSTTALVGGTALSHSEVITLTRANGSTVTYTSLNQAGSTITALAAVIGTGTTTANFSVSNSGTAGNLGLSAAIAAVNGTNELVITDAGGGTLTATSSSTGANGLENGATTTQTLGPAYTANGGQTAGVFTNANKQFAFAANVNPAGGTFTAGTTTPATVQQLLNAINNDTTVGAKAALIGGILQISDPQDRNNLQVTTTDPLLGAAVSGAPTTLLNATTAASATTNLNSLAGNAGTTGTPITTQTILNGTTQFTAGGKTFTFTSNVTNGTTVGALLNAINAPTDAAGLHAYLGTAGSGTTTQLIITDPNSNNDVAVGADNTETALGTYTNPATAGATTTNIFLSDSTAIGSSQIQVTIGGLSTTAITNGSGGQAVNLAGTDLSTAQDAQTALTEINAAITNIASVRGTLGASVNRLTAASNVINSQVQNLTSAENTITAADIPAAVANLTKYSILEQTGISALAQANQQQQLVLKLLQ
ncbi:MAG: beta strand repeat-containing protein [Terracidiphilus sp.]